MLRLWPLHLQHVLDARGRPVRGLHEARGRDASPRRADAESASLRRVSADLSALGIAVGHASDPEGATGLTIVRGVDRAFRCAAAVIGRATGTRELHAASPFHLVDRVDAVVLTGGSAYGLDATAGAMRWMEERGRGHPVRGGVVPIIPAAVIFDLVPLGSFGARPTAAMAYAGVRLGDAARHSGGKRGCGHGRDRRQSRWDRRGDEGRRRHRDRRVRHRHHCRRGCRERPR